jgi:hypothetical protein
MVTPWITQVRPIQDGEEVRAAIANRLPDQNVQRSQHLKDRLDALQDSEALYLRGAALDSTVMVGYLVYFDSITLSYKPSLAAVEFDTTLGGYLVKDSSFVTGIVISKSSATRGDVLQFGFLRDFDFTNTIGATGSSLDDAGPWYLSASIAGRATKQKPPVGIYVMFLRGDGSAHIQPSPREMLDEHIHYAFDLYAQPAGVVECPLPYTKYVFFSSDSGLPGWLPANDPIFNGMAPAGAVFGYNLSQHPELNRLWPPLPIEAVYLESDGVGVPAARFTINQHGLWWFDDCYNRAPWPTEPRPCEGDSSSSSSSSSSSVGTPEFPGSTYVCESGPALEQMGFVRHDPFSKAMRIYFTKMVIKTDTSVVTRLKPAINSPITIVGCDGVTPAETGCLYIGLDLSLTTEEDQPGYQVFKDVEGLNFKRGPVVSGLKAGSNITLTPVVGKSMVEGDGTVRGEAVVNAILPGSEQEEGRITLVALNNVREEQVDETFFLIFPSGRDSNLRARVELPSAGLIENPMMELQFWVLARTAGVLPELPISYRRLAAPDGCSQETLPNTDTNLPVLNPGACGTLSANRYVEVVSEAFEVANGESIWFSLGRLSTDSYAGAVGILRMGYRIFAST